MSDIARQRGLLLNCLGYRYEPGDVAVIHPEALPADVEALLSCIGYANTADEPIEIRHTLAGAGVVAYVEIDV